MDLFRPEKEREKQFSRFGLEIKPLLQRQIFTLEFGQCPISGCKNHFVSHLKN